MEKFYEKFINMKPMKYYEAGIDTPKGKPIIENEGNKYIAMEKRDGEWSRAIIMEDKVLFQSRSISRVTGTYGDKTAHIPHIVNELLSQYPAGTVLLGELAFEDDDTTSKDVGSILRCLPPKAISRQEKKKLNFYAFDLLAYAYEDYTNKNFEERFNKLVEIIYNRKPIADPQYYIYVVDFLQENIPFLDYADRIWSLGGEGIMVIPKDAKYEPGKRTAWRSLKVKKKMGDLELNVVGFIEPNKSYAGTEMDNWKFWVNENDERIDYSDILNMRDLGPIEPVTKPYYYGWKNGVIVNHNGNLVRVTSGLTDRDREFLSTGFAQTKLEEGGLKAIVTGMEATSDSIRHPVFKKIKY